jgi:hypothetical protein
MVAVNHHLQVNVFSKRCRHVRRNRLCHITVEFCPIVLREIPSVNIRVGQSKISQVLCLFFRYPLMCKAVSKCPSQG